MKTFKINTDNLIGHWSTNQIGKFLDQYQIWKDYHNVYNCLIPGIINIQKSKTGIPSFYYGDIHLINQCKEPIVAIDCLMEGKHGIVEFMEYNTDKHYIIFANESHLSKIDLDLKINYTWVTYYFPMCQMIDWYNSPWELSFYLDKEYKFNTTKPMRFVSTTGLVRYPRTYLKDQLLEKIKYKNFIFRYSGVDFGMPADQFDVKKFVPGEFDPYAGMSTLKKYNHSLGWSLPIHMYNQADFNLVVETDIDYEYGFFPTEKILKCLISGIPFVLVATPYFLKYLKELGFHTYNDLWDESYDDELVYTKRIDKIVDLCNNLDSFDWQANQSALELIALKNKCNFLNLNRVIDAQFQQFEQAILELVGDTNENI